MRNKWSPAVFRAGTRRLLIVLASSFLAAACLALALRGLP